MKKILVCDDDKRFTLEGSATAKELAGQIQVVIVDDLHGLVVSATRGVNFDAVFLDGYLVRGTTLPFLEQLKGGEYPHLKETHFYLISNDQRMVMEQWEYLIEDKGTHFDDLWKNSPCKKESVSQTLRRNAKS